MIRRATFWFGVAALAGAGAAWAGTVSTVLTTFNATNDDASAGLSFGPPTSLDNEEGAWRRQLWNRDDIDHAALYLIPTAWIDVCIDDPDDLDGVVQPMLAAGSTTTRFETSSGSGHTFLIGQTASATAVDAGLTYDATAAIADAVPVAIPANFADATEVRFVTTGARGPIAQDYVVTLQWDNDPLTNEQFTIPVLPIDEATRPAGGGDADSGPAGGSWVSAAFNTNPITTAATATECAGDVYADEVVITNAFAGTRDLTSVMFEYNTYAASPHLPGPIGLSVGGDGVLDEDAYDNSFTYTTFARSSGTTGTAVTSAANAFFLSVDWQATFPDDFGEIFLSYACGTETAGVINWGAMTPLGAGLSDHTATVGGLGSLDLPTVCEGSFIQFEVEIFTPFEISPTLVALDVNFDLDEDDDNVTESGRVYDPTGMTLSTANAALADCDDTDGSVATAIVYYDDDDGDGEGDPATATSVCSATPPGGKVTNNTDCRDSTTLINNSDPDSHGRFFSTSNGNGARLTEAAGAGYDYNCDGMIECFADDDGDGEAALDGSTTILDISAEGPAVDCDRTPTSPGADVGDNIPEVGQVASSADPTTSTAGADCDDTTPLFGTAAAEAPLAAFDFNCNGRVDCYLDDDEDGFGSPTLVTTLTAAPGDAVDCATETERSNVMTDCNDGNDDIRPDATEVPGSGIDEDCSGGMDCYPDADSDTHGALTATNQPVLAGYSGNCSDFAGMTGVADDCDDMNPAIFLGAPEADGGGVDNNCDQRVSCFPDVDEDNQGADVAASIQLTTSLGGTQSCTRRNDGIIDPNTSVEALPSSGVSTDCDDSDPMVFAGAPFNAATDIGDGVDTNCDGMFSCYTDNDDDGFGLSTRTYANRASTAQVLTSSSCVDAAGAAAVEGDCNDSPGNGASYSPIISENSGLDDLNCDGTVACPADVDRDGFGDPNNMVAVVVTPGSSLPTCDRNGQAVLDPTATNATDCNDSLSDGDSYNPNIVEPIGADFDFDCDASVRCYVDADSDGFGVPANVVTPVTTPASEAGGTADCLAAGHSSSDEDCNDSAADGIQFNPNIVEAEGLGIDTNCNGQASCFEDGDDDGFGIATATVDNLPVAEGGTVDCVALDHSDLSTDCNDSSPLVYPGSLVDELAVSPQVDYDCSGSIPCLTDGDGDGFGNGLAPELLPAGGSGLCTDAGKAAVGVDCNDGDAATYPGAPEGIEGIDNNCDASAFCYADFDGDGYGNAPRDHDNDPLTPALPALLVDVVPPGGQAGISPGCSGADASARADDCLDCSNLSGGACNDSAVEKAEAATVFPDAVEVVGNIIDEDCDGQNACYPDRDGDGYGGEDANAGDSNTWVMSLAVDGIGDCVPNQGEALTNDDCHDQAGTATAAAFPNNVVGEIPGNEYDDNCDGIVECLYDADGDGFARALRSGEGTFDATSGEFTPTADLSQPDLGRLQTWSGVIGADRLLNQPYVCDPARNEAHTSDSGRYDCYDEDDGIGLYVFPDALPQVEDTGNGIPNTGTGSGIDYDCDDQGEVACFIDGDNDGIGGTDSPFVTGFPGHVPGHSPDGSANQLVNPCLGAQFASLGGDCNDSDPTVFPDLTGVEIAGDDQDNNCDGVYDCYQDLDGDGYGTKVVTVSYAPGATVTCDAPGQRRATVGGSPEEQYNLNTYDCHDLFAGANPGVVGEVPGNAYDDNCDGALDCFVDNDSDGWGTAQTDSVGVTWSQAHLGIGAVNRPIAVVGDSDVWLTFDCALDATLAEARPTVATPQFDCHDTNSFANPGVAIDPPGTTLGSDGVAGRAWNEDCDDTVQCFRDEDDDSFGTYLVDLTVDATRLEDPAVRPAASGDTTKYISKISGDHYLCDNNDLNWAGRGGAPGVLADIDDFDCHDDNASVFPRADGDPLDIEEPGNAYDDNCDGIIDCYEDLDNDHYGTTVVQVGPSEFPLVEADGFPARDARSATVAGYKLFVCGREAADAAGVTLQGAELTAILNDELAAVGGPSALDCHDDYDLANPGVLLETPGSQTLPIFGSVAFDENCDGVYDCYDDQDNDDYGTVIRNISVAWVDADADGHYSCELAPPGDEVAGETPWGALAPIAQQTHTTSIGGGSWGDPTFDCHDTNAAANPGILTEIPGDADGVAADGTTTSGLSWDEDCNGFVECFRDLDDDDYGTYVVVLNVQGVQAGSEPISGIAGTHFDCDEPGRPWAGIGGVPGDPNFDCHDDTDGANPGIANEVAGDAWDNDCINGVLCYEDLDNDTWGTSEKAVATTPETGVPAPSTFDRHLQTDEAAGLLLFPCGRISAQNAGLDLTDVSDPDVQALLDILATDRRAERGGPGTLQYDCHDDWSFANPEVLVEEPGDPFDNDCDGTFECYADRDGDGFGNLTTFPIAVNSAPGHDYDAFPWGTGKGALPSWPVKAFPDIDDYRQPTNGVERAARENAESGTWYNCLEVRSPDPDNALVLVANAAASGGEDSDFLDCHDDEPTVFPGFDDTLSEVVPLRPEDRTEVANQFATCGGPIMCVVETPAGAVEVYDAGADACCLNPDARVESPVDDPDTTCPNADPGRWRCFESSGTSDNGEVPGDQFDNDCDGLVMCYQNNDNDGTGTIAQLDDGFDHTPSAYDQGTYACTGPQEAEITGDCHDNRPSVEPPQAARALTQPGENATDYMTLGEPPGGSNLVTTSYAVADYDDVAACPTGVIFCYDPNNDIVADRYDVPDCDAIAGSYRCYPDEIVGDVFDQDCDGAVSCFYDQDQDGFGIDSPREADPNSRQTFPNSADGGWYICAEDRAPSTDEFDCNDTNPFENPEGVETDDIMLVAAELAADPSDPGARARAFNAVGNDIDENCDGVLMCWADEDNDGYGLGVLDPSEVNDLDDTTVFFATADIQLDDDWDDGDSVLRWAVVPAPDGRTDCLNPGADDPDLEFTGVSYRVGDCHDDNADANPAAASVPGDSFDNDCDATWLCYEDLDGDSFGTVDGNTVVDDGDEVCNDEGEAVAADDCLDDNSLVVGNQTYDINSNNDYQPGMADPPTVAWLTHPGGLEFFGDGIDGDCNGLEKCFVDGDLDGYVSGAGAGSDTDRFGRTGRIIDIGPDVGDQPGKINCGDILRGQARVITIGDDEVNLSRWPEQAPFAISVGADDGLVNAFVLDNDDMDSLAIFDCDDDDDSIFPQSVTAEIWYDGIDQNCDNRSDFDQDGDGYDSEEGVREFGRDACPDFEALGQTIERYDIDPVLGCGPGTDYFDLPNTPGLEPFEVHRAPYDRDRFVDINEDGATQAGEDVERAALVQICDANPSFYLCSCFADPSSCPCPVGTNFDICNDALSLPEPLEEGDDPRAIEAPIEVYAPGLLTGIKGDPEVCEEQGGLQYDNDGDGSPNTRYNCWFNYELYLDDMEDFADIQRDQQLPWRPPSRELYTFCLEAGRDVDYFVDRADPLDFDDQDLNTDPTLVISLESRFQDDFAGFVWDPTYQPPDHPQGKFYRDLDEDGEGDRNHQGVFLCDVAAEEVAWDRVRTDCDDSNPLINARGTEVCDRQDNNCNGEIDEPTADVDPSLTECEWHYIDGDGDSWGLRGADPALQEAYCICPFYEIRVVDPSNGAVISQAEPQVCQAYEEVGDDFVLEYGHKLGGACFVKNDKDCNDLNFNIKPFDPGERRFEFIDGIDNDCNDELPLVELDCDDDNAYPYLPQMDSQLIEKPRETPLYSAQDVGLQPCCVEDGDLCISGAPPNLFCWGENLPLRCDTETKLWVVKTSALGERFAAAARVPRDSDCGEEGKGFWDCDDTCPARCAGLDEQCDGLDNDCNGFEEFVVGSAEIPLDVDLMAVDDDGIPDVMQGELRRIGLVDASELDLDGDQYVSCDPTTTAASNNQREVTDRSCRNYSLFEDCNDRCALSSPSGEEAVCNGFVENSDCAAAIPSDVDGDGHLSCGTYGTELEGVEKVYALVFSQGSIGRFLTDDEPLQNLVPLIPPRRYSGGKWVGSSVEGNVRECDTDLESELSELVLTGDELMRNADDVHRQLLEICVLADSCREQIARNEAQSGQQTANDNDDAAIPRPGDGQAPAPPIAEVLPVPEYCAELADARCSVAELTLSAEADLNLFERDIWPGSESCVYQDGDLFHPEQAISRTVWSQEQIVAARKLVIDFECYRMFGTFGCAEPEDEVFVETEPGDTTDTDEPGDTEDDGDTILDPFVSATWISPYEGLLTRTGGFFSLPEVPQEVYFHEDNQWWLYLGRYTPLTIQGADTIVGCWGDPIAVDGILDQIEAIDRVGGDCAQTTEEGVKVNPADAHRGMAEGPGDLVGWYQGESVHCSTCLDGIDNNCNSLIDQDDPACTQCFVGQGYGCGCSAGNRSSTVGRTAPAWLLLWALVAVRVRRREHT